MKMKHKTLKMLALLISALMLFSVVPVGVSAKSAEKLDYVGMISRRDKYDKYVISNEMWYHRIVLRIYTVFGSLSNIVKFIDDNVRDMFFASRERGGAVWKDEQKELAFNTYVEEQSIEFPGLPQGWYFVRYASITREQLEESVKKYMANENLPFESWMVDAMYCDDIRTVIETYMSPDFVMNMDWFNAKYGSGDSSDDQLSMGLWANGIIETPIETLEKWGYSDAYWLDYYSFIRYLQDVDEDHQEYWSSGYSCDSIVANSTFRHSPEKRAELDRRVELYANRVANAETGDDSAVRAVFLATAAVMCAVIPVMATVKRRRRED